MAKLVNYRLDQQTQSVDKHNDVVERTYHLEQEISVAKEHPHCYAFFAA